MQWGKKSWGSWGWVEGTGRDWGKAGGQLVRVWGGVGELLQLRSGLELGELLVLGLTNGLGSPCAEGD